MTEITTTRRLYLASTAGVLSGAGCLGQRGGDSNPTEVGRETEAIVPATKANSLSAPIRGDPDADVTVSTYEDFACPHCREYTLSVLPKVVEEFADPEKIRYERRDFPIPVHEKWSWAAANAARAVQADVGMDAFWRYSDLLYENQEEYGYDLFPELAEQVDADPESVRIAVRDGVYRPVLREDRQRGRERGVTGTPTVFVDGRHVESTYEDIRRAIRDALDSSG